MWGLSDDYAAAMAEGRKAVALEPSNADAMAELAYILAFSGESEEASELIRGAKRLNPNFPVWYHRVAGVANFLNGDYAKAVSDLKKSDEDDPVAVSRFWLASAWGHLGKLEDAKTALQSLMGESRGSSQFAIARMVPLKRPRDMKRFLEGLDKAGVPEEPRAIN
jgi:Flp pilus assembly protein TadD